MNHTFSPRLLFLMLIAVLMLVIAPAYPAHAADSATSPSSGASGGRITPVVKVVQKTRGAVVNISSTQIITEHSPFDQLFNQMLNMPDMQGMNLPGFGGRKVKRVSVGSGFVINAQGYIVTNAHVVNRTAERKVTFADGKSYDAKIIAIDTTHDLALLKIDAPHPLPTIQLGTSSDLMVGETVVAIGNPFGYQHTVTAGVVSAIGRTLHINGHAVYKNLIQTDASINPGNSGGPLLNILGQLVGINTAIRQGAQGIGFAIPVDELRKQLPTMLDVERRYHFVTGLSVANEHGQCVVSNVAANSPAAAAGLKKGQAITAVGTAPVRSVIDFYIALIGKKAGETLTLGRGQGQPAKLTLAARPRPDGAKLLLKDFGIEAKPLTPDMAKRIHVPDLRGLLITGVELNSPADQLRLNTGDILVQIGQHQVGDLDDVGELLERVQSGDRVRISVLRIQGHTFYRLSATITAR